MEAKGDWMVFGAAVFAQAPAETAAESIEAAAGAVAEAAEEADETSFGIDNFFLFICAVMERSSSWTLLTA